MSLKILPGVIVQRDEFLATHPPYSIALDGYVSGEPFLAITPQGPYRNFNHHESVDRSCTSATCEQVRRAVILGLYDLYQGKHGPRATLWVNDCDQDVCLATWILFHPHRAGEPWVRTLAYVEDLLDMSAGGFPLPDQRDLLGEIRWVFEPYTARRPEVAGLDADGMAGIIHEVHQRIERFLSGQGETLPLLGDYRQLGGGHGWVLVELDHQHARQKMVEAGVKAAVELFARKGDRYVYAVWRRSEYIVDFPVAEILRALNQAEGYEPGDVRGWGGSENVGGSPRGTGSRLTPAQVEAVVNKVVEQTRGARLAAEDPDAA
ncbi:MAG TPA: hypothetical protein VKZ63_15210 [Kofleriaceae bacterium]|nr:hypothetical protein [Kofleriaceae bacterium]